MASTSCCLVIVLSVLVLAGLANGHAKEKPGPPKKVKGPAPKWPGIPLPPHQAPKKVSCNDKKFPFCCNQIFNCPLHCPLNCVVDCLTCHPVCECDKPGAICQDPRFIGADGLAFYFHGKKDRDFCLVADTNLHINGHFIGKRNSDMKRDFTWVQSLGILFGRHKLYVGAMKTASWNNAIDRLQLSFDGEPVFIPQNAGAAWRSESSSVTITRVQNTNAVEIEAKNEFKIKAVVVPITRQDSLIHNYNITDNDCFAHLDLSFKFHSLSESVNGVLGQTYATDYVSRAKMGVSMPVLGGEKEFSSSGIFSADCSVATFTGSSSGQLGGGDLAADLSCATGSGAVVCKR